MKFAIHKVIKIEPPLLPTGNCHYTSSHSMLLEEFTYCRCPVRYHYIESVGKPGTHSFNAKGKQHYSLFGWGGGNTLVLAIPMVGDGGQPA